MATPRMHRMRAGAHALLLALGLALSMVAQAGSDRIFANGFESCCRLGGTVSGLTGSGLVLHLSAGVINENRTIGGNGLYAFATNVAPGTAYVVSVGSQPSGQICTLANASGTMGSNDFDLVDASCAINPALIWDQGNWGKDWQ